VFDRIDGRRILNAGGLSAPGGVYRHLSAWLAILGLYVQLFAAGLCTAGSPFDPALGNSGQGAFPICHAAAGDPSAPAQGPAPAHQACPFCALHCQAAMVFAPSVGSLQSFVAVSSEATQAPFVTPNAARFPAGAPPRGPPPSV
jgi:hypothetical protein